MLRSIIAVTVGVLAGVCVVIFSSILVPAVAPIPEGIDPKSAAAIGQLPLVNKVSVIVIWAVATALGSTAASLISMRWAPAAWVVAATMLLFAISNFASFSAPIWMVLGSLGAIAVGGLAAIRLTGANYTLRRPDKPGKLI